MIKLQSITLPDGFLREETRDGYTVSAKMKEVWAVELDLLQCFMNVCEKNGLRYFMDSGTLLGAARHHGFIPWDNDIDVSMLYDDYVKLREIAKSEFNGPYFFQSEYDFAQVGAPCLFSRLFNTETTAIARRGADARFPSNQGNKVCKGGIWIDIFPLVGMPPAFERKQYTREMQECQRQMKLISRKRSNDVSADIGDELLSQLVQLEKLEKKYPISPTTKKVMLKCSFSDNDREIFNYWDFQDTVPLPFEMLTPTAPRGYKNYLRTLYGTWKIPAQQYSHGEVFFDTDRPNEYWLS